jgi:hypothetical protein
MPFAAFGGCAGGPIGIVNPGGVCVCWAREVDPLQASTDRKTPRHTHGLFIRPPNPVCKHYRLEFDN